RGPLELVGLGAVQEVELRGALLDGRAYGEAEDHEAHALLREPGIEAGLVEVESPAVAEGVEHGRRFAIQVEREEAKPAALEGRPAPLLVEGPDLRRIERLGAASPAPAQVVQAEQAREHVTTAVLAIHQFEGHSGAPREGAKPPPDVVPVLAAQRRQIG